MGFNCLSAYSGRSLYDQGIKMFIVEVAWVKLSCLYLLLRYLLIEINAK